MKKIFIDVPMRRQAKGSVDCGPACLSMILRYYGIDRSIEQIKHGVKVFKGKGVSAPNLATYMLSQGFDVEIITMNPYIFTNNFKKKTQKQLASHIKKLLSNEKKKKTRSKKNILTFEFFLDLMNKGGKIRVKIPEISDIKKELQKKHPICSNVTSRFLLSRKPRFNLHYNVITGIDDTHIYVNDPLPLSIGGRQKYPIQDYIYAMYSTSYFSPGNSALILFSKK